MIKRLGALGLVLASLPLVSLASAGSAIAQQGPPPGRPCGNNYTNGQPFSLATSPTPTQRSRNFGEAAVRVTRGAEVKMGARLRAGQKACPRERVGFYTGKGPKSNYRLLLSDDVVTSDPIPGNPGDPGGLVNASRIANEDFRFYADYNINAVTNGVESGFTLVQVR